MIISKWKDITKGNLACFFICLSKSKCFSVRPFLMQTDNSYQRIPLMKLHIHFIISILKRYYFKRRFGRIGNTLLKKMKYFLTPCSWRSMMSSYRSQPPFDLRQKYVVLLLLFFWSKITWSFTFLYVNKILCIIFENSYEKKNKQTNWIPDSTLHLHILLWNFLKFFLWATCT